MALHRKSHCKVNLLLNILGKRQDGYHNLESLMCPAWVFDVLTFKKAPSGVSLTCSNASLSTGPDNLVFKAATAFLGAAAICDGVKIQLEKNLPVAAGLGGGSGNGACALLGLNELFDYPMGPNQLHALAACLGSDVPFFLQSSAALVFGKGEIIEPVPPLAALEKAAMLIVRPGFGISTPWAYRELARFPQALNGTPGRAQRLAKALASGTLAEASPLFYNALEAPALEKYPLLALYQEFFRENGAVSLMSGSGSSTFALTESLDLAHNLAEQFKTRFGNDNWMAICPCVNPE